MKNRQNIRKFLLLIFFILYPITFFIMSPDLLMFGASDWIKWLQFIPWITFFIFLVIYFGGIKQADFFYKRALGVSMVGLGEWVMYFGTVAIVFSMAVLTGKRGLCHYLCWVSPFMIIGGKIRDLLRIPSLRLITKPDLCNSCGICSHVCPMSLPLDQLIKNGEIGHLECTLCATCVDSCPKDVIRFAFRYHKKEKN